MTHPLYHYYERELVYIRRLAQEFAHQYPATASRLLLDPIRSSDPHVERLIESFAFLTARIQQKLDDEYPQITEALLNVLYPHYLAPVPSMAVVQLELEPANAQPQGVAVPRHSRLHTQGVRGMPCRFRTGYPVTLWPMTVSQARLQSPPFPPGLEPPPGTVAVLRLQLECQGSMRFSALQLDRLRLHLYGDSQVTGNLYELIFNHTLRVSFRPLDGGPAGPLSLRSEECLFPVGFEEDEGLLPYPPHSFLGYRLLSELFSFPAKFLFVDLGGWREAAAAGFGRRVEVTLFLNRTLLNLEQEVGAQTFALGCTPVVNLFEQTAEPIALTGAQSEYLVTPDVHAPGGMEVYSVDRVTSAGPGSQREYHPFYGLHHASPWSPADEGEAFWYASRRTSLQEGDRGTDVFLHLVDRSFQPRMPATSVLVVRATCTSRDLPVLLAQAGEGLRFTLETAVPLRGVRCLRVPTAPLRPPLGKLIHWRLISHLMLNHLSLSDPVEGRATLQEILRLYDFSDPDYEKQLAAVNRNLVDGIASLTSRPIVGQVEGPTYSGFARGIELAVELDEQKYVGTGMYLFASVLERFLRLYTSMNGLTQLVARARAGDGFFKRWPPRSGEVHVL